MQKFDAFGGHIRWQVSGSAAPKAARPLSTRSRRSAALNTTTVAGSRPAAFGRQSGRTGNAQKRTYGCHLPFAATPEHSQRHQGPDSSDRKEASRRKEPRHDFGARPWVFRAITRETKKVYRNPEHAEEQHAPNGKRCVGSEGDDAFHSHSDAPALPIAQPLVRRERWAERPLSTTYRH